MRSIVDFLGNNQQYDRVPQEDLTDCETEEQDTLLTNMEARTEHQQTKRYNFLYGIATGVGVAVICLVLFWCVHFRNGFSWSSDPALEFNWHPLLMTTGMIFLYAQSILVYRSARNFRKKQLKLAHGFLHLMVFILTVIGLKAVFDSHNLKSPPIPNLYSLHSWIGLLTVILFTLQLVLGFVSFLYPGLPKTTRAAIMPIHVTFGTSIFIMATVAAISGLLEKAIFTLNNYAELPSEGIAINLIGIFTIGFALLVLYLVNDADYKRHNLPEDGINLVDETHSS
ncbi:cytochrome b reductase 1 [Agrilus planipennis]|uniref:Cytochrome b reductase 1 n=1 Tax=Agrilus planipennis TaxID=224129 RepID=A0A1W4WU69_AGRPL|nr:cytochrome b reductase 1 [Agrilus planipennis]